MLTLGDLELRSVIKFLLCQVMCKKPIRYATVTVNCRWRNLRVLKRVFNLSFLHIQVILWILLTIILGRM